MPSNLYKRTLSENLQEPVKNLTGGTRQFGMVPADILGRSDLSAGCKIVLAGMAMEAQGAGKIAISHQALAFTCGMSRPAVLECLVKLAAAGLIEKDGRPVKQVQPYRLLHQRFMANRESLAAPQVIKASISCPRCRKKRPMLLKTGICRSCNWEMKVRRIAREEVERVPAEKSA